MKTHLTYFERQKIELYLRLKWSVTAIGRKLRRNHSVISREIRRNTGTRIRYSAVTASRLEDARRRRRKGRKLEKDALLHDYVVRKLRAGKSPDVIAGRMKVVVVQSLQGRTVSHESIYRYVYEGEGRFEGLYHFLKRGHRRRHRRFSRKTRRKIRIPERVSIHARPDEVMGRGTFGHWESDTVLYQKQRAVLSVQIERKSRLVQFHRALSKSAEQTEHALRKTVESLPGDLFRTMTFDNGTEGARHRVIGDEYGIDTYFCDAYASWQKGAVENVNRIIRQFLPKTKDLSVMTDREIHDIQETINDTPRKCLGYRTPNEVIAQYLAGGGALLA